MVLYYSLVYFLCILKQSRQNRNQRWVCRKDHVLPTIIAFLPLIPDLGSLVLCDTADVAPPTRLVAALADLAAAAAWTILVTAARSKDSVLWAPDTLGPGTHPRAPPELSPVAARSKEAMGTWSVAYPSVTLSTLVSTWSVPPTWP